MGCGHTEDTGGIVDINPEWILVVFIVATEVDQPNLQAMWKGARCVKIVHTIM